ncbi:phosphoglycerate kinase [Lutibaculum baratangense]|uniref:Phosphoglycerate kinase n=1 Tax=Lutibaculum baratangense AMV1 TaxID=631454 RepID=V4TB92_9HYPH|nr:phosphoglycerate kinase [Lutibaculum baratangense]ESR23673.1 Phosphoglycerate kinase [Lutibaculum baratangense AMV1]
MDTFRTIDDLEVEGRRVVLRADLNVPVSGGHVTDATRVERAADTIKALVARGASVVVLSHFGRPKGKFVGDMSLEVVLPALESAVGQPVKFVRTDWTDDEAVRAARLLQPRDVMLCDNTRFHPGEEKNDEAFARTLASLGDCFVNDAFSAAHRAHSSTEGIAHLLPSAAGVTMAAEIEALERALERPERPVMAIVGGAKVSTKIDLLGNLVEKVDALVIGGGMANTFLAANGHPIGKSLHEADRLDTAREIEAKASERGCEIVLPVDVVAAGAFEANAPHRVCRLDEVSGEEMILDIGPGTIDALEKRLAGVKTVVWNGPFGAFELTPFDAGTVAVARRVAALAKAGDLVAVAGGGDTVAALNAAGVSDDFTFVSTAGGAFLEWLEGKSLPGVAILRK